MWAVLATIGKFFVPTFSVLGNILTGGGLDSIMKTVDTYFQESTNKDAIKGKVIEAYLNNQAQIVLQRTWWFQLFFVIPLGFWWSAVIVDSVFHLNLRVAALPPPLDSWAGGIISALFVVDSTKSIVASFLKK
jgi:hypothetical protein